MTEFYAQPYSLDHTGFYFDSVEKYEAGMKRLNAKGCEEVEIQVIDGEDHLVRLASAAKIHQCDVHHWFEELDDLDKTAATQVMFLLEPGYQAREAMDRHEDVYLFVVSANLYDDHRLIPYGVYIYIIPFRV